MKHLIQRKLQVIIIVFFFIIAGTMVLFLQKPEHLSQYAATISPTPTLGYPQDSNVGPFTPHAVVIDYNTSGRADDGSSAYTQQLVDALDRGSSYHNSSVQSVNFHIDSTFVENNQSPLMPHRTYTTDALTDYQAVFTQYNICNRVINNGLGFVIIWSGNNVGDAIRQNFPLYEWEMTGPTLNTINDSNMPTCRDTKGIAHTVVVFGLNYERDVASAVHSTNHYMENVLSYTLGPADPTNPSNQSMYEAFVGRYDPTTLQAHCGDVHRPPNTLVEYQYDSTRVVSSNCATYNPGNPNASVYTPVDVNTWKAIPCTPALSTNVPSCTEESFHIWWMQNIPGYRNTVTDKYGYPMPNLWQYIVALDTTQRIPASPFTITPTPTPACQIVDACVTTSSNSCAPADGQGRNMTVPAGTQLYALILENSCSGDYKASWRINASNLNGLICSVTGITILGAGNYIQSCGFTAPANPSTTSTQYNVLMTLDVARASGQFQVPLASTPTPLLTTTPTLQPTITSVLLLGDINGDGHVDVADLSILTDNFNLSGINIINGKADINGDTHVNVLDLSILADHFGQ